MTLGELADMFGLELTITRFPNQNGRHIARFERVETKPNKEYSCLTGEYGDGETPSQAIKDYCEKLKNKWCVYDAYGKSRKEFGVPNTLEP